MKKTIIVLLALGLAWPVLAKTDSTTVTLIGPSGYYLEVVAQSLSNGVRDTLTIFSGQPTALKLDSFFRRPKYKNRNFEFREASPIAYEHLEKWKKAKIRLTIRYFGDQALTGYYGQRRLTKKFKKGSASDWTLPEPPKKKVETVAYCQLANQTTGTLYLTVMEGKKRRQQTISPGRVQTVMLPGAKTAGLEISGSVKFRSGRYPSCLRLTASSGSRLTVTDEDLKQALVRQGLITNFRPYWIKITGDLQLEMGPNSEKQINLCQGDYLQINVAYYKHKDSPMPFANSQHFIRPAQKPYFYWDQRVYFHLDLRRQ